MQAAASKVPPPLDRLTDALTPAQLQRIARIQDEAQRKRAHLAADPKVPAALRLQYSRTIAASERDGIYAVLTPEQRRQLQALRSANAKAREVARKRLKATLTPDQRRHLRKLIADGATADAVEALLSQGQRKDFLALGRNPKELGKL